MVSILIVHVHISYILNNEELKYEWKLPEWINDSFIWDRLENNEVIKNYHLVGSCKLYTNCKTGIL